MAKNFGIIKDTDPTEVDIATLHLDKTELKLIKIGLFEVSEYLDSPKLRELRQRVNSLSGNSYVKLPSECINNDIASELRMGKAGLQYVYTGDDL